jgi:hypothetical protein
MHTLQNPIDETKWGNVMHGKIFINAQITFRSRKRQQQRLSKLHSRESETRTRRFKLLNLQPIP